MIGFLRTVLERDNYDVGLVVVRGLGVLFALGALLIAALAASGSGVVICLGAASLFMLAAIFPRVFGKVAGGVILLVAFVVMITGPNGEAGLSSFGLWRSLPLYLLAGLFMRPEITSLGVSLFRHER